MSLEIFVVDVLAVAMVVCEWQETRAGLTYDADSGKDGRQNLVWCGASECNVGNSTSPFTVSPSGRRQRVSFATAGEAEVEQCWYSNDCFWTSTFLVYEYAAFLRVCLPVPACSRVN